MSAIKKFFQRKKLEKKFKNAGQGHQLNEASSSGQPSRSAASASAGFQSRQGLTNESRAAAEAALQRMAVADKPGKIVIPKVSMNSSQTNPVESPRSRERVGSAQVKQAEASVKFVCDLLPGVKLTREAMITRIEEYLLSELPSEPQLASALMIHTLNKDRAKVQVCIDTLCKYLDNICEHPTEEKYRKIRFGNKAFQERVVPMKGAQEFMQASGFEFRKVTQEDGSADDFLILSPSVAEDPSSLAQIKEVLLSSEAIMPELDHDVRVFAMQGASAARFEAIPADFYSVSREEIKRQQELQKEAVEKMGMLRTKVMRERDEQRELRLYRYCYMRIRFPDNSVLQATFRTTHKLSDVYELVKESIAMDWVPFKLASTSAGQAVQLNPEKSLAELKLVPTAVLNFEYDKSILNDIVRGQGPGVVKYLKVDLMQNLEVLR